MQGDQGQVQGQQGQQGQGRNEFSGRARNVVQAHTVHLHESAPPDPAAPRMAPAAPTRFVVREELGRAITEALRPGARVVLAGGGGYGKTAMAGWAARGFEGAVLWAELGQQPGTERIVASLADLTAALTGTGGRTQTYADVHAASGAFGSAVAAARGRTLLVVDDAWQTDDVRPFLVAADRLTVLVTTRRPGLVDGTEIRVDAMNDHEAVALLGGGDPAPLLPLLDRIGRWPLALAMLRGLVTLDGMTVTEAVAALIGELDAAGPAALDEL
ncbi:NB-ARC domain-containing protein [Streptomyces xiamenensis]